MKLPHEIEPSSSDGGYNRNNFGSDKVTPITARNKLKFEQAIEDGYCPVTFKRLKYDEPESVRQQRLK
ncbi:hypothetical protein SARC_12853 [Sphaeroforma arctica JP610]|uniref:Uncharacterized protein n=1 Tax=Sphaeroforma arctica JP610 TaxID=667725 RepID=A0A0L0FCX8_9EUKA|nr:hypothetical protein SARC_12853 [Sphaeroforma arctica JP610]KNC74607.1 hypothetical protein SARC_12853 [Sphaeroforma arctica JP610]|eukprot:XP_014148509.1 hypothetical protein SARC_12853 [Sphaeroforma arctica JP610]